MTTFTIFVIISKLHACQQKNARRVKLENVAGSAPSFETGEITV